MILQSCQTGRSLQGSDHELKFILLPPGSQHNASASKLVLISTQHIIAVYLLVLCGFVSAAVCIPYSLDYVF